MHPFSKFLIRWFVRGALALAVVIAILGFLGWLAVIAYRFGPVIVLTFLVFYWIYKVGTEAEKEEQEQLAAAAAARKSSETSDKEARPG